MPTLLITAPDSKQYKVPVAEGQTNDQARDQFQKDWEAHYGSGGGGTQQAAPAAPAPAAPAAPAPTIMQQFGRSAGLTVRHGAEMAMSLPAMAADAAVNLTPIGVAAKALGYNPKPQGEVVRQGLTKLGLPLPESSTEKGVETAFQLAPLLVAAPAAARVAIPAAKKLYGIASGKATTEALTSTGRAVTDLTKTAMAASEARAAKASADAAKQGERAQALGQHRQNIQKILDTPAKPGEGFGQIGTAVRSSMEAPMETYAKIQSAQGVKDVAAVLEHSRALEASGKYLPTTTVVAPLKELAAATRDIPGVGAEVEGMLQMFGQSSRQQKQAHAFLDMEGKPLFEGAQEAPLTMEKAEHVRRKLSDMAYGVGLQKQGTSVQMAAKKALRELDAQMENFVPAHKVYKDNWRNNARPMDVLDTKFSNFVSGAKGGVDGEAYYNLHASELPKKFFEKQGGMELLTDTLAGGKAGAVTAEAHAHAAAQVDDMALKYFKELGRGMTSERKLQFVANPVNRGVMERLPAVQSHLTQSAGQEQKLQQGLKVVRGNEANALKYAEEAKGVARAERASALKLQQTITAADAKLATREPKLMSAALGEYRSALEQAQASGSITKQQYKLALGIVARANGVEAKVQKWHQISRVMLLVGAAAAGGGALTTGVRALH